MQQWPCATAQIYLSSTMVEEKVSEDYIYRIAYFQKFKTNRTEQYHSDKYMLMIKMKFRIKGSKEIRESKEMR